MTYTELFAKEKFKKEHQWFQDNLIAELIMGSHAYGVNKPDSDFDVVAIVMNQHQELYPQAYGYIIGFDTLPSFVEYGKGVIEYKGVKNRIVLENDKEVEGEWRSLTNFFKLAGYQGSPNLVETLFVRRQSVKYGHKVWWMMQDNRKLFLSMKTFEAFKGYAFQQLKRIRSGVASGKGETPERQFFLDTYGYDVNMAYHCLRLCDQLEQILVTGDLDLMKNKEECKAMRHGEWGDWKRFEGFVLDKLEYVENKARESHLSPQPQSGALKKLLAECLEEWYGSEANMQKQGIEYVSTRDVFDKLNTIEYFLKKNYNVKDLV